jgi:type IV pilus assembly protein PilN
MIKINLLPVREERRRMSARQEQLFFFLMIILVMIGIYYWHSSMNNKIRNTRQEIAHIDQEIARLSKIVKQVEKFKSDKKILEEKIRVISQLKENRQAQVHVMDEINKALPSQVWLQYFQERGGNVTLRGKSLSPDDIADFMRNLEASDYFRDIELDVTTQKELRLGERTIKVNDFSIRFKMTGGTDPA